MLASGCSPRWSSRPQSSPVESRLRRRLRSRSSGRSLRAESPPLSRCPRRASSEPTAASATASSSTSSASASASNASGELPPRIFAGGIGPRVAGAPREPAQIQSEHQQHLQKINQLTFDRRPSAILHALVESSGLAGGNEAENAGFLRVDGIHRSVGKEALLLPRPFRRRAEGLSALCDTWRLEGREALSRDSAGRRGQTALSAPAFDTPEQHHSRHEPEHAGAAERDAVCREERVLAGGHHRAGGRLAGPSGRRADSAPLAVSSWWPSREGIRWTTSCRG